MSQDKSGSNQKSIAQEGANQAILLEQYQAALDLYKHEDSLNWSKVNNFFYITAGLGALLSYVLKNEDKLMAKFADPLLLVALLGLIASIGFSITIFFGVKYMINRKKKVAELDQLLRAKGGVLLLGIESEKLSRSDHQQLSPTILVLVCFPIIIGCLWLYVFIAALMR